MSNCHPVQSKVNLGGINNIWKNHTTHTKPNALWWNLIQCYLTELFWDPWLAISSKKVENHVFYYWLLSILSEKSATITITIAIGGKRTFGHPCWPVLLEFNLFHSDSFQIFYFTMLSNICSVPMHFRWRFTTIPYYTFC